MAKRKQRTFTEADVNFAVALAVSDCVNQTLELLLLSGAEPSGEIGRIIMHFANGKTQTYAEVQKALKEIDHTNPANMEKIQVLQEIVSGKAK
ncbi:hypothetical protein Fifi44_00030 [Erwinia phage Fifi44]|uniref:Uncharacterized protein n=1 Tax=Erwinia phage Fifi44 TaxID=2876597 RepID=A0AAE8Y1A1_9CAUD|nr:hypothetical protein QNG95_gp30 [Erwinia phage Fifi44]QQV88333.1 hypothetical protein pEaSNUABM27_00030 [Erwinia phage pEa_SNUABM_27]UCR74899.1 hypothetical protein Fifi44_00030 [Erwinia phage Fifi44]UCR80867.1 hypothetical protein Fifi451_00047 [Erwinia phage Fifi451]